jgi:uncharacterized cupin superfamily protein
MSADRVPDRLRVWRVDENAWEFDPETDAEVAMLVETERITAGLWRWGPNAHGRPMDVELTTHETIIVLDGTGTLEVDAREPIVLAPGVAVTIPAGSHTRWTVDPDFREVWIYY